MKKILLAGFLLIALGSAAQAMGVSANNQGGVPGGLSHFDADFPWQANGRSQGPKFNVPDIVGEPPINYIEKFSSANAGLGAHMFAVQFAGMNGLSRSGNPRFTSSAVTPLPASAWLFISGLVFLAGMKRRRRDARIALPEIRDNDFMQKKKSILG